MAPEYDYFATLDYDSSNSSSLKQFQKIKQIFY